MITNEAESRKLNEDLFYQYLKGLLNNADREDSETWEAYHKSEIGDIRKYLAFVRASEKRGTISLILSAYQNIVLNGGK